MLDGHVIVGLTLSITTMLVVQLAVLELESVATNVTVVVPTVKRLPLAGPPVCCTLEPHASFDVAFAKTATDPHTPASRLCVIFDGHVMVGGVTSCTVIEKVHDAVLPLVSRAVNDTLVTPTPNRLPDAGPLESMTVWTAQLSVAVAARNVACAPQYPASVVRLWLAGQVIFGGSLSVTETEN
jgi:hypothetical protein